MEKAEKARALRYKRPMLKSLGRDIISNEMYDISEACADVHWFFEGNEETLLNAFDGNEEEEYEFKIAFADLEAKVECLQTALRETQFYDDDTFDDCTVALIGRTYEVLGYDGEQEDYFSITRYEQDLATTEAGKRLMRMTKQEMLSTIGQCVGITLAFCDLRQQYDYLKATMDIIRDENVSVLKQVKAIEQAYEDANAVDFCGGYPETKRFDQLLNALPERSWLE